MNFNTAKKEALKKAACNNHKMSDFIKRDDLWVATCSNTSCSATIFIQRAITGFQIFGSGLSIVCDNYHAKCLAECDRFVSHKSLKLQQFFKRSEFLDLSARRSPKNNSISQEAS